jgi:predicted nucleic acid-binding protein
MIVYAESSAVLAWLLGQRDGDRAATVLAEAEMVVASDLTLIECDRVLIRAVATQELKESEAAVRQARLNAVAARWTVLSMDEEIVERTRRAFPVEPLRTLDAVHVASALAARKALPEIAVLSLDIRIRQVSSQLGFRLAPGD